MPDSIEPGQKYAIMRTRFQPFNVGHKWAMEQFFRYREESERVFNCERLWLCVVDPEIHDTTLASNHPRALPELNPLKEWQVAELIQLMTCRAQFHCDDVVQIRIPSFMSVRDYLVKNKNKQKSFQRILGRIPNNRVWYFPVFDMEDVLDIELIWDTLGREKIIIAYHPMFKFDLTDPFDKEGRFIGIYAAALAEMLSFAFVGQINGIIPQEVKDYIGKLGLQKKLDKSFQEIKGNNQHPFLRDDKFEFVGDKFLVARLQKKFKEIFTYDHFDDYVKFLPPDRHSESFAYKLIKFVRDRKDKIPIAHQLIDEMEFKIPPLMQRLDQICTDIEKYLSKDEQDNLQSIKNGYKNG